MRRGEDRQDSATSATATNRITRARKYDRNLHDARGQYYSTYRLNATIVGQGDTGYVSLLLRPSIYRTFAL